MTEKVGAGEGNRTLVFSLEGFRRLNAFKGRSDKRCQTPALNINAFLSQSERAAPYPADVFPTDHGTFEIGLDGPAFPSRLFAEAVWLSHYAFIPNRAGQ